MLAPLASVLFLVLHMNSSGLCQSDTLKHTPNTTSDAEGITQKGAYVCASTPFAAECVLMEMFRDVNVPMSWLAATRVDT